MYNFLTNNNIESFPYLEINLNKIRENTKIVNELCQKSGVEVVGVTKVTNGSIEVAQAMVEGGIKIIGD